MTTEKSGLDGSMRVRGTTLSSDDSPELYRQKLARITLDSIVQFVGLLDAEGSVLEINQTALEAIGLTLADVEGKPFWETFWWQISDEIRDNVRNAIRRAGQGESSRWDTELIAHPSGEVIIVVDAVFRPVTDDRGKVVFITAEGRDVTEKRAHEVEIARQREELAKLDALKTHFFTNISHEFRTPLTLMLGPVEELLSEPNALAAGHRDLLDVTHRNGLRLLRLVNTLLNFSRLQAGRTQALYEPVDLAAHTDELASNFRAAAEKAGLRLTVDAPPLSGPVYVDRGMWEQIVLNLLSNAFKFTFEGEITVSLRKMGQHAQLTVRDTGVGIASEQIPKLFERFYRVEGSKSRSFEGSGIGLALVRDLVQLHGGDVSVTSELDRGSAFIVNLPLGTEHLPKDCIIAARPATQDGSLASVFLDETLHWLPETEVQASTRTPERGGKPEARQHGRILVADDNPDMLGYVRRLLVGQGYEVETVADGAAALTAVRRQRPDLLVSDVMMPQLDGFGLLKALRKDSTLRDLPVIILSARSGEEAGVEGLDAGASDYLTKPFAARELLARVAANLAMARSHREAAEALRQSQKMEAIGQLTGGVAHDFNNLLTVIRSSADLLKLPDLAPDRRSRYLAAISDTVERAARLTSQLLAFARRQALKPELFDATESIEAIGDMMRTLAGSRIQIVTELQHKPCFVNADPSQFDTTLVNMAVNARDAMNGEGMLTISVKPVDQVPAMRNLPKIERPHVAVSVTDTGCGIPEEHLDQVFEPFFTTKPVGQGTGLGLSQVFGFTKQSGGEVLVTSAVGRGTTFTIYLPREFKEPETRELQVPEQPLNGHGACVAREGCGSL